MALTPNSSCIEILTLGHRPQCSWFTLMIWACSDPTTTSPRSRPGDLKSLKVDEPITFKGKQILIQKTTEGRYRMKISMETFINGLDTGRVAKGRSSQDPKLTSQEHQEFRSVSGFLQWTATQCRSEVAPLVSLANQGNDTTYLNLKSFYQGIDCLKESPAEGLIIQDIPFTKDTMVLAFSNASWCNASRSGSQIGLLVGMTTKEVKNAPAKFSALDWRSSRAPRVCRSTL